MPVPAISKRFGIAVRNHRIAAAITQEVLAERAGLHATYVGMVERGIRNSTLDVAARIAKALKADLPILIGEALPERVGRARRA
jgi:transcriptional regulator with XRE-family HTH domain